jgi:hypothetical protein
MLFNQDGFLILDEAMMQSASFQNIMEDGVVTNDELASQVQRVTDMLHEAEKRFKKDDLEFVEQLLVEANVLFAVYNKYELQKIR